MNGTITSIKRAVREQFYSCGLGAIGKETFNFEKNRDGGELLHQEQPCREHLAEFKGPLLREVQKSALSQVY